MHHETKSKGEFEAYFAQSALVNRRGFSISSMFPPTLAEIEWPQPQLLLPLARLHLHGAQGGVDLDVAAADRPHVLRRDGGAIESAATPGKLVRAELAGRLEVAVDVLAGLALLRASHVGDGGGHASHRRRRLGRC